jgi:3-oxoisoapionate decarboxylase
MSYTRREMLATCAAAAIGSFGVAADGKKNPLGVVSDSFANRLRAERERGSGGFSDPLHFLEHCRQLGAAGVQLPLGNRDAAYTSELRKKLDSSGMYLEGSIALPRDTADVDRFSAEVRTAKEAGATVLRTVMLGGRRYETFASAEAFRAWGEKAVESLVQAERIIARQQLRLAVENHKDWRTEELTAILKRIDSQHIGVCVDTGNSIALLEDPYEVVEAYAPWAYSTHLKDMAVHEYEQGFLLAEVPLGQGFLDIKRIATTVRRARPEVRLNLEMITRDPLKIPCLTAKYWATLDGVPARSFARMLALVRQHAAKKALPRTAGLSPEQQLALEEGNVRASLAYATLNLASS